MMGEMTAGMTAAIASSPAPKYLLPITQENIEVIGATAEPLPHLVEYLVQKLLRPMVDG
jgi:hypothetical protein